MKKMSLEVSLSGPESKEAMQGGERGKRESEKKEREVRRPSIKSI